MKYYYLNEQREVQGPFTAAEMRRLLAEGIINGRTLASEAGGSGWQELAMLNLADPAVPAGEPLGPCPHCGNMLTGDGVPPACPHCGKGLHPGTENLWQNAVYAFMQYVTFRGRATRREFWSFILFSSLVEFALCFSVGIVTGLAMGGNPSWDMLMEVLVNLLKLAFFLPTLAVTVRRLHDTGHSGWWAVAPYGSILLLIPLAVLVSRDYAMGVGIFMFVMISLLIWLYVFIQTLMPSHHGPNKHGPSLLFPRS